jgi:hypothetical protein
MTPGFGLNGETQVTLAQVNGDVCCVLFVETVPQHRRLHRLGPDLANLLAIRREVECPAVALGKLAEQDQYSAPGRGRGRGLSRRGADLAQAIGLVVHFDGFEPSRRRW